MFVGRPGSNWPYEFSSFDIFEASILHPAFKKRAGARLHLGSSRRLEEHLVEDESGGIWLQRAVRRRPCQIKIDALNPSAGFGISECNVVSAVIADVFFRTLTRCTA